MCKKILLLLTFLVFVCITCYADDPVDELLNTYQDIITLSQKQSFNSADVYTLQQDIDMSGHPIQNSIGYNGPFLGTFNGNGYTIKNLTFISTNDYIGFFSKNEGTITGLTLDFAKIIGNDYVGGLVAKNQGIISGCTFSGEVTGNDNVGGLVGYNSNGTIILSSSLGEVTGNDNVGGLVGYSYTTLSLFKVETSSSSSSVTGHNYVGGLIGYYRGSDIENCCYRGLYICDEEIFSTVIGEHAVGGLIGNFGTCLDVKKIKNCYSLGNIQGTEYCGGLVGIMYGAIVEECYSFCDFVVSNPP